MPKSRQDDAVETADDASVLMRAPLFRALGPEITRSVAQKRSARRCARGETICQQGDPADSFFVVIEGWVKQYRERESGDHVVVEILSSGESFAEAEMFLGGRYPTSAEAISPARIMTIDGAAMRRVIVGEPQIAFDMLAAASLHLKGLVQQIEQLKSQCAPKRIAEYFLDQVATKSGPATIALPYEKALIANRLGMRPASFSRALSKLAKVGVAVDRDSAHIKDVADLVAYCRRSSGSEIS